MWEAFKTLFQNPMTLAFVGALIAVIILMIKKGSFSYSGHGVQIGKVRDNEREIIMKQIQHVENNVDAVKINKEGLDYYHTKYVLAVIKLLLIKSITYNHIKDDDVYVQLKQEELYNAVLKRTTDDYFRSSEFKSTLEGWTLDIIRDLVKIRRYYS